MVRSYIPLFLGACWSKLSVKKVENENKVELLIICQWSKRVEVLYW